MPEECSLLRLRIICDREEEINSFIPEEYWTIDADVNVKGEKKTIQCKILRLSDGKNDSSKQEKRQNNISGDRLKRMILVLKK